MDPSPVVDQLSTRAMPQTGEALRRARDAILARWRQMVTAILPHADELTRRQLENSLPDLLGKIAEALASDNPARVEELIALAPAHGRIRYHQEFSLFEVLVEYHLLRRIAIEELARELGRPLTTDESVALHQGIDVVTRQAATAYATYQTEALKIETASMTKFLSFLSHDLRGSLNGAVLMIEVLKRELAPEQRFASALDDLEVVRRSILDTVSMMERFLSAEKLRHGRVPVKLSEVDVAQLAVELHRGFAYQLKDREIELEVEVPAGLKITSDRELLTMVLQNLISNAIKYAKRQNVRLSVTAPASGSDGQIPCRFIVSDKGPGIATEKLATIFAPFERGETYGQKGVGLGLYIVRQAADLLGARVWAESELGQGARFYLDLSRA